MCSTARVSAAEPTNDAIKPRPEVTPPDQHLLVEQDGGVLIVTMNRPERRNALSPSMMEGLSAAWDEVNANPDIRVAILTGAGGCFCAGADLQAMTETHPGDVFAEHDNETTSDLSGGVIKPLLKGFLLDKPLIAAVEGPAVAGGTEILQATDIRIAGESARFGVSEVRWSLYPLGGSVVRLRRQIPYTVAADLLLTGRHVRAPEAKEIGLIGEVVPDGMALDRAREVAAAVAANGPIAVQAVLRGLRETECVSEQEAMRIDSSIGMRVFMSDDAKEGPLAFMEKRTPQFKGQ
jgi:enoyl-CoA hydratase/carnithine racemase